MFSYSLFGFCSSVGGTLDRYEKKIDAVENGSFPPTKEVADFEQAIELTGN